MLRFICYFILLDLLAREKSLVAEDSATNQNAPLLDARSGWQNIWGEGTNGLQPDIMIGYSGAAGNVPFTNDYVLKITPLIYKVETNQVTVHLVEFPPIEIKLMANGNVRKSGR